jgi:hypothetical protein
VTVDASSGRDGRRVYSRKNEEYMADFCLVSKRTLCELDYRIFKYHFILGADWRLCCRQMKIDRGTFFHAIYRIEQQLGRMFSELAPYALFPLDEYFGGRAQEAPPAGPLPPIPLAMLFRKPEPARRWPWRPPLLQAA